MGGRISSLSSPRKKKNTTIERYEWWLTSRRDDASTSIVPVLYATTYDIVGVAMYNSLGSKFWDVERVVTPKCKSRGYLTIISLELNGSSVNTFRLQRDCILQLVLEEVLVRRSPFPSSFGMDAWWRKYDVTKCEKR